MCIYVCVYIYIYIHTYIYFSQFLPKRSQSFTRITNIEEGYHPDSLRIFGLRILYLRPRMLPWPFWSTAMWRPGDTYQSSPCSFALKAVILRPILRLFPWTPTLNTLLPFKRIKQSHAGKFITFYSFFLDREMSNNNLYLLLSHILEINLPRLFTMPLPTILWGLEIIGSCITWPQTKGISF